jgi:HNH endonuclease
MRKVRVPGSLRRLVAEQARHRCGYCLTLAALTGAAMEIEHLIPTALGGRTAEENLWLSCRRCNSNNRKICSGYSVGSKGQTSMKIKLMFGYASVQGIIMLLAGPRESSKPVSR